MKVRRIGEDRLQWAASVAATFLEYGEKGDDSNRGVRLGVLANRLSRRYRFTDEEAIALARRAFELLVMQGLAVYDVKAHAWHGTMKLANRAPHEGLFPALVMRARQWRTIGYQLPMSVRDELNVRNVSEDEHGNVTFEVLRD